MPLLPVVASAVEGWGGSAVLADVLAPTRVTRDQSALDAVERASNLAGAMRVRARHHPVVKGAVCVVVDDLVTSGATLTEAARALTDSGAGEVLAAAIGATRKRTMVDRTFA